MAASFPQTRTANQGDRLGFSLFIAVAAHALVIFGIGFKLMQQPQSPTTLDVTLAQHNSETSADDAEFLAQFDQQGSGDQQQRTELTSNQQAPIPDQQLQTLAAPSPEQLQQQQQTTPVITAQANAPKASKADNPATEQQDNHAENLTPATLQQLSNLRAKLDRQQQQYSRLPRTLRLTTASTKAAEQAAYLHYWIAHVESVGNQNYPEEARRKKLYGDLRLAVTLLPDGTVDNVEILLSSGQRVLDQAAIRIVRMASPFSPLPAEMREWDKLEVIRTWRFERGHTLHTES